MNWAKVMRPCFCMRSLISWSTAERNRISPNGQDAIAPSASLSMMVCGRFYSLRVESPSGYDILRISGFLPSPPHAAHGMRGGGQITRRKPVASATSLSTACTITSWGCGLTSAIPRPLLQHAAVLTRVECWMIVAHFQPGGSVEPSRTAMGQDGRPRR